MHTQLAPYPSLTHAWGPEVRAGPKLQACCRLLREGAGMGTPRELARERPGVRGAESPSRP